MTKRAPGIIGSSTKAAVIAHRKSIALSEQYSSQVQMALAQAPAVIWTTDADLRVTSTWGGALRRLNLPPDKYIGKALSEFLGNSEPNVPYIAAHLQALDGESVTLEAEFKGRTFRLCVEPLRDSESRIAGTVGVALDVTEQRQREESIRYLALHDPLTGLANYRALVEVFDKELQRSERTGRSFAVMLLDMDGLKQINDQYGHLIGSRSLCRLAGVLRRTCRATDTPTRYGGDEFGILLVETDREAASHLVDRITENVAIDCEEPHFTVSAGIAVYPKDGGSIESLLASADQDLYRNKLRAHLRAAAGRIQQSERHAVAAPEVERRRSERLPLDVPLVVCGESVEGQTFQEETFTISVSAHGALVVLAAKVELGQVVILKNRDTQYEEHARISCFNTPYGGLAKVAVEFERPAPEFWRVDPLPERWRTVQQTREVSNGKLVGQ